MPLVRRASPCLAVPEAFWLRGHALIFVTPVAVALDTGVTGRELSPEGSPPLPTAVSDAPRL